MKTNCAGLYFVWMFVNKCCLSWYSKIHDYCNFFQLAIILEKSILRWLLSLAGYARGSRLGSLYVWTAGETRHQTSVSWCGGCLTHSWMATMALKGEKMRFILVIRGTAKARHKIQRPINIHTEMTSATLASAWKWWQFPLLLLPARFFQGSFIVSKSDGKWP